MNEFSVNIRQVVRLLGERLYSNPSVVVRELIQNAYDAIHARYGSKGTTKGQINIFINPARKALTFSDNGSGMNEQELVNYLSRLGDGVKIYQGEAEHIGEYGIGFFSSFIIADRIVLRTRKTDDDKGYIWSSSGVEGYDVTEDPEPLKDAGTSVTLYLQQGVVTHYTNEETIIRLVKQYCNFLDCPIYLNYSQDLINERKFPWEYEKPLLQEQWFKEHLNPEVWYHKSGTAKAGRLTFQYAFCCGTPQEHHEQKLYCKRMFVTGTLRFVPNYLSFIDVAVACDALRLNLGREGVQTDSTAQRLYVKVEELLLEWVGELVRKHRKDNRLIKIIRQNQEVFKDLALDDPRFFNKIYPYLLFPLYGGEEFISISDYLSRPLPIKNSVLCTFLESGRGQEHRERERFLLRICEEKNIPVILIENESDDELLRRVCTKYGTRKRRLFECQDLLDVARDGNSESVERVRQNIERFFNKRAKLVEFVPEIFPLAFSEQEVLLNTSNNFLKQLGEMTADYDRLRPIYDCMLRLFAVLDRASIESTPLGEIVWESIRTLENWCNTTSRWEEDRHRLDAFTDRWWTGPLPLAEVAIRDQPIVREGRKFHTRCFIVCPFSDAYRDLVNVVKSVCEEFGILADTAEAPETREILTKVCRYIDGCDFAIVDISENNPNILFELGLIMARRKPAIIVCNKERRQIQSISIPTDIIGVERVDYSNTTEDLRDKLRRILRTIGGGSA
jgi:molecular chaperone HtpG